MEWSKANVASVLPADHRGGFLRVHADGSFAPVFNEQERSLGLVEVAGIRTKLFTDGDAVDTHCRVILFVCNQGPMAEPPACR